MEIVWYGHACFRLRTRGCAVVCDPFAPDLGYRLPRLTANVATISTDDAEHNYAQAVRGGAYVVTGPGEYEVAGTYIVGAATGPSPSEDRQLPVERPLNTAYLFELEGLSVCHLGCIGDVPDQAQVEQFDGIDILLVPVGGGAALSGAKAAETVNLLEPRIVIPMYYLVPDLTPSLATVTRFLTEMGVEKPKALDSFSVTREQLPDETRVILLEPRREQARPTAR